MGADSLPSIGDEKCLIGCGSARLFWRWYFSGFFIVSVSWPRYSSAWRMKNELQTWRFGVHHRRRTNSQHRLPRRSVVSLLRFVPEGKWAAVDGPVKDRIAIAWWGDISGPRA